MPCPKASRAWMSWDAWYFPPRTPELAIRNCARMIPSCYRSRGTRSGFLTRLHNTLEGTDGPKRRFHQALIIGERWGGVRGTEADRPTVQFKTGPRSGSEKPLCESLNCCTNANPFEFYSCVSKKTYDVFKR